jgi:acetyl-CoA carboxylase biotin carboxyl carrier protein
VKIDLDQIRNLLAVVGQTDITELTIESGEERITVKKSSMSVVTTTGSVGGGNHVEYAPVAASVPVAHKQPVAAGAGVAAQHAAPQTHAASGSNNAESASNPNLIPITSPMVGTFYRAPSPTAPAFVEVGDTVSVGQTVCIIEAMKLMNDMPSEVSGKIVKILVENGATVEFGQNLMLVDPKG